MIANGVQPKPFLRWAGGKNWLTKHIIDFLPKTGFNTYHEPFLGGASIFFAINPKRAILSDLNKDLIDTYIILRDNPLELINSLKQFKNTEDFYYEIRAKKIVDPIINAAKFIFLNQTSFNGIFRVNKAGEYNVPYGFRKKNFLEEDKLLNISNELQKSKLIHGDFSTALSRINNNDLVFLDPPYTVSHNNNGFIKYNQKLFSIQDQIRLSEFIDDIKSKNAYYILTNAAHPKIIEIFSKGDSTFKINRANLIGGINAQRGQIEELIFTNAV